MTSTQKIAKIQELVNGMKNEQLTFAEFDLIKKFDYYIAKYKKEVQPDK